MLKKIIVGLTGQSGSGKSTVAKIFKQNKFDVIDADACAKRINSTKECAFLLSSIFGESILNDDETLNRKALANIVFSDKNMLQKLNQTMFPIVIEEMLTEIAKSKSQFIIVDAPQLFESGFDKMCDHIIAVTAAHDILIERITARDGISVELAEKRLASQFTIDFFKENCEYVIESNGDFNNLNLQVEDIVRDIRKEEDIFEF